MSATITLKNIPKDVYVRLKQVAELHHRSLNSEVIACLEHTLLPNRVLPQERLVRARQLRAAVKAKSLKAADISKAIEQGRS